ncbi:AimR family lysis-lysogeny pheromone receptor [Bacillus salitolerans]|uniref:AimR family lysis-lysogeny pheromone receptor n=1 Tax=Bacillus salitolerans TaxID=1437434 RepID=A0ABW4LUU0_9BACI
MNDVVSTLKEHVMNNKLEHLFPEILADGVQNIPFQDMYTLVEKLYKNDIPMQRQQLTLLMNHTTLAENLRVAMEFYTMHGEIELLEELVNREKSSKDPLNREWAEVYEIVVQRYKGELFGEKLNQIVLSRNSQSKELHLLLCILHMFGVYDIGEYEAFFKVSNAILPEVQHFENEYIKTSYELHLYNLFCFSHLLANKVEECRHIATCIVTQTHYLRYPIVASNAYHVLAQSYMFESFEESMKYIKRAEEIISILPDKKKVQKSKDINNTKEFLRSYWKRELDSNPDSLAELAHRHIVRGNIDMGIDILDEIRTKQGNHLTAFQWYYYGLATNNMDCFKQAKQIFTSNKDRFFIHILKSI